MEKKKTNERAITLISLVITIVVLLILAGVAINLATDENGLFRKVGEAVNKWNDRVAEEDVAMENIMLMLNEVEGNGSQTPTEPVTPVEPPSALPEGWSSDIVVGTVEEGERIAPIPSGFVASQVAGESTISDGLVIYETDVTIDDTNHSTALTTYNQYVWIPVDDINDMVMCSVCGGASENLVYNDATKTLSCTSTHAEGASPTLVGKLYTTYVTDGNTSSLVTYEVNGTSKNATIFTRHQNFTYTGQTYNANSGYREPAVVTGKGDGTGTSYDGAPDDYHELADASTFLNQLQGDFTNMAKSVGKYGGFYVGRYEAGTNGETKKGQTVMTAADYNQMWYGLYNTLRSDPEAVSSTYCQMIWGSQYDQMMKFLEEDPTNEPYIGHTDRGLSSSEAVSGNTPLDEMSNIFDLEGNYHEWTSEAYDANNRVLRGGYFISVNSDYFRPAGYCGGAVPTDGSFLYGSRPALYVRI